MEISIPVAPVQIGRNDYLAGLNSGSIWYTSNLANWANVPGSLNSLVTGDFNGDGRDDLAGLNGGSIWYTINLANWTHVPGYLTSLVAGDFNGDGRDDLAGLNGGSIWYTTNLANWTHVPGYLTSLVVGDFNGDGKADLAGLNGGSIWYTTDLVNWHPVPGYLASLVAGDFNHDGRADLAGLNAGTIWYTTDLQSWHNILGYLNSLVTGDLDGDGDNDLAGLNGSTIWYSLDLVHWNNIPGYLTALVVRKDRTVITDAQNQSYPTSCAEEDNINVPLFGNPTFDNPQSFVVTATHPTYNVGIDNCSANFQGCPGAQSLLRAFTPQVEGVTPIYDDGETVVECVLAAAGEWWRPYTMQCSVEGGPNVPAHFIRVSRKIADQNSWPQFFVLYQDGNMRLIPHPPSGIDHVCFGSSVIVGPAEIGQRPFVDIASANYIPTSKTLEVSYRDGGSAVLSLREVDRTMAKVHVTVNHTADKPFAVFRSMFVSDGNADVDHVRWEDILGIIHNDPILTFSGGSGWNWSFNRNVRSIHNTSAPNIEIKGFAD